MRFTWWIGNQVYHRSGAVRRPHAGGELGRQASGGLHVRPRGSLDGEWADGTATDRLELFARAERDVPTPGGRYTVNGRNPNGSRYSGTVSIARRGDRFELAWQVGTSSYRGTGTLENNLLTVNWGSTQPLVYALSEDGSLRGLWSGGQGEDVLTPAR